MKARSNPVEEHREVPLADNGRWEDLIHEWSDLDPPRSHSEPDRVACYVVSIVRSNYQDSGARLAEITGLVAARNHLIVGSETRRLRSPDPRSLFRSGVAAALADRAKELGATMLVVDDELSPSQMRNLEDATGLAVCDREAVILGVFRLHARTTRSRIQVEVAHLEYLRPRIRGIGLEMDQQAGGVIGNKGSGETASELLARRLDTRLAMLRKRLKKEAESASVQRKRRKDANRIALVGYTNAGKTTLMNALTEAGLSAADKPFETLETTSRALTRHGGDVLISDTVGFIRNLPERLFESFASTLTEVAWASLLVIVVDVSDPELALHIRTTREVLTKIGAEKVPKLYVFNKLDQLGEERVHVDLKHLADGDDFIAISTRNADDVERVRSTLLRAARKEHRRVQLFVPYVAKAALATIHAKTRVLAVRESERGLRFTLSTDSETLNSIKRALREES